MRKYLLAMVIGAALGGLVGYFGQCSTGTCPLTANPWRGALAGAVAGLLLAGAARSADRGQQALPPATPPPPGQDGQGANPDDGGKP